MDVPAPKISDYASKAIHDGYGKGVAIACFEIKNDEICLSISKSLGPFAMIEIGDMEKILNRQGYNMVRKVD